MVNVHNNKLFFVAIVTIFMIVRTGVATNIVNNVRGNVENMNNGDGNHIYARQYDTNNPNNIVEKEDDGKAVPSGGKGESLYDQLRNFTVGKKSCKDFHWCERPLKVLEEEFGRDLHEWWEENKEISLEKFKKWFGEEFEFGHHDSFVITMKKFMARASKQEL